MRCSFGTSRRLDCEVLKLVCISRSKSFLQSNSAESVAMGLLRQFEGMQLPAASELDWLVPEQDAPQKVQHWHRRWVTRAVHCTPTAHSSLQQQQVLYRRGNSNRGLGCKARCLSGGRWRSQDTFRAPPRYPSARHRTPECRNRLRHPPCDPDIYAIKC